MKVIDKYAFNLDRRSLKYRIKETRAKMGLTQPDISSQMGISHRSYTRFESMEDAPTWDFLDKFIKVTGVSREWLLYGSEDLKDQKSKEEIYKIRDSVANYIAEDRELSIIVNILKQHKPLKKLITKILVYFDNMKEVDLDDES